MINVTNESTMNLIIRIRVNMPCLHMVFSTIYSLTLHTYIGRWGTVSLIFMDRETEEQFEVKELIQGRPSVSPVPSFNHGLVWLPLVY